MTLTFFTIAQMTTALTMLTPVHVDQVLSPFWFVFVVAFLVSFLMTPIMRKLALANGVMDLPDKKRKTHLVPIAYLGGVAIFLGWLAGIFVCFFCTPYNPQLQVADMPHVGFPISILFGATVITLVGLIDDVYGIIPRVKVGGQLLAAGAMASQDVGIRLVQGLVDAVGISAPYWVIYTLGAAAIAIFVIGGCNAVNLIDGLDGLAAGVGSIASIGFLFIAIEVALRAYSGTPGKIGDQFSDPVRITMCLATLGALLGFLPYNFNPATIFMGDTGSLLVGYLCVTMILLFAHADDGPILVLAALIVFALPIIDTTLAIVRRKIAGQKIFSPDSNHLHHQMLRFFTGMHVGNGLNVKLAVVSMYAIAGVFAVLGCSMVYLRWRYVLAVFMVVFGFVIVTAYKSGHRRLLLEKLEQQEKLEQEAQQKNEASTL